MVGRYDTTWRMRLRYLWQVSPPILKQIPTLYPQQVDMHFRNAFGLLPQYTFQRNFFRSYDLVIESLAIQRQDLIFEHKVVPQGEGVGPVVVNFVLEILASSSDEVPVGVDALRVDETQVGELVHRVHQLVVALLA